MFQLKIVKKTIFPLKCDRNSWKMYHENAIIPVNTQACNINLHSHEC